MLDFSFSELLLCFVVALVVLGPERLPGVARGIGRWTGKARTYMRNLSAELDRESQVAEFKKQMGDAKRILDEESTLMRKSFDETISEGRAVIDDTRQQLSPDHHGADPAHEAKPESHPEPQTQAKVEPKTPDFHV